MVSTVIPEMLYRQYFWWIIAFVLLVAIHFAIKKSPPIFPGAGKFLNKFLKKHEKGITKIKRIILLIVCLLPILLTVIQVLTGATESLWLTIQLCIYFSIYSWIINMPSVLVGKSLFELLGNIHKKMKLMFSHHAG